MALLSCDRCGTESPATVAEAIERGWSRFEVLREDGETIDYVMVCPDCLTDAEDRRGTWPSPARLAEVERRVEGLEAERPQGEAAT
jgi:hypothetical protein